MKKMVKDGLLVLISLVLSLYLVEAAVTIKGLPFMETWKDRKDVARWHGLPFDQRSLVRVVRDFREKGDPAVPMFFIQNFVNSEDARGCGLLPLAGPSNRTTVIGVETGKYSFYRSDRHGFNNPDQVWDRPVEVALVGDSYVHGACVQAGEDIASALRSMGLAALSLGVSGDGPLLELAVLKEYALPRQPRAVVWAYFEGNDLNADLPEEQKNALLLRYLEPGFGQGLAGRQAEIDACLRPYLEKWVDRETAWEAKHRGRFRAVGDFFGLKYVRRIAKRLLPSPKPLPTDLPAEQLALFERTMAEAKRACSEAGADLLFLYIPAFPRYEARFSAEQEGALFFRDRVLAAVQKLGLPVLDLHEAFLAREPDPKSWFPLRIYAHFTPEGYRRIAELVRDRLAAGEGK